MQIISEGIGKERKVLNFLRVMSVCERGRRKSRETLCDTNFSLINEETTPKNQEEVNCPMAHR